MLSHSCDNGGGQSYHHAMLAACAQYSHVNEFALNHKVGEYALVRLQE